MTKIESVSVSCLSFAVFLAMSFSTQCRASYPGKLRAAMELPPEDGETISPEKVIEECSHILSEKEKYDTDIVYAAFQARGNAYLQIKNCEGAKKDYACAVALRPSDYQAKWHYANALVALGLLDQAEGEIRAVIRSRPDFAPAYVTLGIADLEKGGHQSCLDNCSRAVKLDNTYALAYYTRALSYYRQGDLVRCLEDVTRYLELQPINGSANPEDAYIMRRTVLLLLSKPQEALPNFLMARRLNSRSPGAVWGLWQSYTTLRKPYLACQLAEELVRLDPNRAQGFISCAQSYASLDRSEDALRACEKGLALEPKNLSIIYNCGNVYARVGKYEQALRQFDKLLELNPRDLQALTAKALLLSACPDARFRNGPKAKELALAVLSVEREPWKQPECLMALAMAHAECGDFKEAESVARKALEVAGPSFFAKSQYEEKLRCFQQGQPFRFGAEKK